MTLLEHQPYSPVLAPFEFFIISRFQVCVKRNQIQVRGCSEGKSNRAHE